MNVLLRRWVTMLLVGCTTALAPVGAPAAVPAAAAPPPAAGASPLALGGPPGIGNIGITIGRGGERDSSMMLGPREAGVSIPDVYVVQPGDTLWDLCGYFFANPYLWPKIWSYNPLITNPHWIYPGDVIKLAADAGSVPVEPRGSAAPIVTKRLVPEDTVFLRRNAFVTRKEYDTHGAITGATEDKFMLTVFDTIYIRFPKDSVPALHDRLTLYERLDSGKLKGSHKGRPKEARALGTLVNIVGTAEVTRVLDDDETITAVITEALAPIERDQRAGPVTTAFKIVPPRRNARELEGRVVEAIHDELLVGPTHLVIVDKGTDDGVEEGNRFIVLRRGDGLPGPSEDRREKVDMKRKDLPFEAIGELMVVEAKKNSSTCFITRSVRDVQIGDDVLMRKGY